jgi:hypothetical protein
MNIYRWEGERQVVEIMAKSLNEARGKAMREIDSSIGRLVLGRDYTVRQCSKPEIAGECVKRWAKH